MGIKRGCIHIENNRPIAIYDAGRQQLIGVFAGPTLVAKYVYGIGRRSTQVQYVSQYVARKMKSYAGYNSLGLDIAFRYANQAQMSLLGEADAWTAEGYPEMVKQIGFTSTRGTLWKEANIGKDARSMAGVEGNVREAAARKARRMWVKESKGDAGSVDK